MKKNYYMLNMQKLLQLAVQLHQKGFSGLEVIPSLSPSGVYWRCDFVNANTGDGLSVSSWLHEQFDINAQELLSASITEKFQEQHHDFILSCGGMENAYSQWLKDLVSQLESDELPYAFSDYYNDPNYWQTSKGKKIKTLH